MHSLAAGVLRVAVVLASSDTIHLLNKKKNHRWFSVDHEQAMLDERPLALGPYIQ